MTGNSIQMGAPRAEPGRRSRRRSPPPWPVCGPARHPPNWPPPGRPRRSPARWRPPPSRSGRWRCGFREQRVGGAVDVAGASGPAGAPACAGRPRSVVRRIGEHDAAILEAAHLRPERHVPAAVLAVAQPLADFGDVVADAERAAHLGRGRPGGVEGAQAVGGLRPTDFRPGSPVSLRPRQDALGREPLDHRARTPPTTSYPAWPPASLASAASGPS